MYYIKVQLIPRRNKTLSVVQSVSHNSVARHQGDPNSRTSGNVLPNIFNQELTETDKMGSAVITITSELSTKSSDTLAHFDCHEFIQIPKRRWPLDAIPAQTLFTSSRTQLPLHSPLHPPKQTLRNPLRGVRLHRI